MGDKEEKLIYAFKKKTSVVNDSESSSESEPEKEDTRNKSVPHNQDWRGKDDFIKTGASASKWRDLNNVPSNQVWRRRDNSTTPGSSATDWSNTNSKREDSKESGEKQCSNRSWQERRQDSVSPSDSNKKNSRGERDWNNTLPSQVFDEMIICWPPDERFEDDCETTMNWGKWMIFPRGQLDKLDSYWIALKPLYESGVFSKLKASTIGDKRDGVINCYTTDAQNEAAVKRAGDAIREQIDYEFVMYYKTNIASVSGRYNQEGFSLISKYMHTVKGGFYSRDNYDRWKSIDV